MGRKRRLMGTAKGAKVRRKPDLCRLYLKSLLASLVDICALNVTTTISEIPRFCTPFPSGAGVCRSFSRLVSHSPAGRGQSEKKPELIALCYNNC